ncbi:MAG TPA: methylmalonyl Co-A mutase-associated GTPase MeaB, partial [Actinomycetota bacterium]|nr:methylmalonyl Co-A mutase-associated GTPase MeaB [Actinomycetota bacterium]
NKADREGAEAAVRDLRQMIRVGEQRPWTPPVVTTTAARGDGVDALWSAIEDHRSWLDASGHAAAQRRERLAREVEGHALERLRSSVRSVVARDDALLDDLVGRRVDPYRAVAILVRRIAGAPPAEGDDARGRPTRAPG